MSAESLTKFPLILPEPDAGIRELLNRDLEAVGVTGRIKVAIEVGGWSTILAFVRAGIGVGIVSRAACREAKGLAEPRPLDPVLFRPLTLNLICRKHVQSSDRLDLSDDAQRFRGAPDRGGPGGAMNSS